MSRAPILAMTCTPLLTFSRTGFGNHGDYVFGWRADALQKAMDTNCATNCPGLKVQTIPTGNQCTKKESVKEDVDGCEYMPWVVPWMMLTSVVTQGFQIFLVICPCNDLLLVLLFHLVRQVMAQAGSALICCKYGVCCSVVLMRSATRSATAIDPSHASVF